jgi:hypothetical protein
MQNEAFQHVLNLIKEGWLGREDFEEAFQYAEEQERQENEILNDIDS